MVLGKFLPEKLPSGKFPPIKLSPMNPALKIPTKFPTGIFPPISLTGGGGNVQRFPTGRQCLISPEWLVVFF